MIGANPDDCDFRYGGIALNMQKWDTKLNFLLL